MVPINIPFTALLFQGIPEQMAVVTFAFMIARIEFKWKTVTIIGAVLGCSAYLVRLLPIPFGIHTILLIILLLVFLITFGQSDLSLSFLASLLSFLTLAVFEFITTSILMPIFKITPEILFVNPTTRILLGEPHVLLIFISAFIIRHFRKEEN